jgi:hypothetical protein
VTDVSRGPASFRRSDLTKAVQAVVKAGLEVRGVRVYPGGQIELLIQNCDAETAVSLTETSEWDNI